MKTEIHPLQVIVYEGTGASPWADATRFQVTTDLLDQGYAVLHVRENASASSLETKTTETPIIVLGQFAEGAPVVESQSSTVTISTHDTSGMDAESIVSLVTKTRAETGTELNSPGQQGAWKPWFPVIDYDRCTNCMQCLSFCLFDVYGVDEEKQIQVQNNDNCKTNCPACSRVCPEVAIMFPKYTSGPINGEPVRQQDVERESMKVDITALLGGDIYSSLRTRSEKAKSRFSKERSPDKALNERKRCLTKLQQSGIIPAEVLAELDLESLPSAEAIQEKAAQLAKLQQENEG
ncbi:MAG: ferredoxin family protein [Verrucomicrobiales bacterium]|jgi:Pyruvate/2-oxoacid:ferredoxin oxidoreductase delta subunit|nr:ferredoxin family protein [Verrucomicrobiales bacterium]